MKKIFIYCLISVFIVSGCKKESKQPSLLNTKWVLSYIQNTKTNVITIYPADESNKIIIDFTNSLNIVSFSGICNSGTGTYSFSTTGTLKIADMATTKIACLNVEWESYTIQSMQTAYNYSINGSSLVIYSNGDYNLYFISK